MLAVSCTIIKLQVYNYSSKYNLQIAIHTWAVEDVYSGILTVAVEIAGDESLEKLSEFFVFS